MQAASGIAAAMQEACSGSGGPAVTAVCGSKGTGKSTFARLLLNSLLNVCSEVALLEADCGQPEFSVPGERAPPDIASGRLPCGSSRFVGVMYLGPLQGHAAQHNLTAVWKEALRYNIVAHVDKAGPSTCLLHLRLWVEEK